jgi:hypothetical protein
VKFFLKYSLYSFSQLYFFQAKQKKIEAQVKELEQENKSPTTKGQNQNQNQNQKTEDVFENKANITSNSELTSDQTKEFNEVLI